MSDFDTRRISEIASLEEQIKHLQDQVRAARQSSTKWEPKVTSSFDITGDQTGKISLKFGDKTFTSTLPIAWLRTVDLTSATTAVIDSLYESLIRDQLRPIIEPSVEAMMRNAISSETAGKW